MRSDILMTTCCWCLCVKLFKVRNSLIYHHDVILVLKGSVGQPQLNLYHIEPIYLDQQPIKGNID